MSQQAFSSAVRQKFGINNLCLLACSRKIHTSCVVLKTIRISDLPPKREPTHVYMRQGPGPRGDPRKRIKRLDYEVYQENIHNVPFDPKLGYLVSPKEVHPSKWGGDQEVLERIGRDPARYGHPPGYYDKQGKFVLVPEMVPEFVVPDISECNLRPYVNYALEDVGEEEMTPMKLFKATYGSELMSRRADMTHKDLDIYLDTFIDQHSKMAEQREQQAEASAQAQGATT